KLDWIEKFVRSEVEPLDFVLGSPYDVKDANRNKLVRPLQEEVRKQKLWACHLEPELGGQGYGQVKLALMNEILGRSRFAPTVFGCQAPETGNSEILAKDGTPEQKKQYLEPLLRNEIVSCFSMTEPQGGADPKVFATRAELKGDNWVINGEKWFSSNANYSSFLIVMAVTDPDASPYNRLSTFIVPAKSDGLNIVRSVGVGQEREGTHGYVRYQDVTVPKDHLLGPRGGGFVVAQTRLGGGRIHHAMRTIGQVRKSFDQMCERALSRTTQGSLLADKQMVQEKIADSWIDIEQFRLLVLRTAWRIDKYKDYLKVRKDIAAVKAAMPKVFHDVVVRALQVHGSLGVTPEMPFAEQVMESFVMGLADGPTEVHKITLARQVLREYKGTAGLFPTGHIPA
ncbi:MAG: acyl-CoA dehydrogenase family protein, partial [Gammaproteobacteria bacterium]